LIAFCAGQNAILSRSAASPVSSGLPEGSLAESGIRTAEAGVYRAGTPEVGHLLRVASA
jgi:hypothetical protein